MKGKCIYQLISEGANERKVKGGNAGIHHVGSLEKSAIKKNKTKNEKICKYILWI